MSESAGAPGPAGQGQDRRDRAADGGRRQRSQSHAPRAAACFDAPTEPGGAGRAGAAGRRAGRSTGRAGAWRRRRRRMPATTTGCRRCRRCWTWPADAPAAGHAAAASRWPAGLRRWRRLPPATPAPPARPRRQPFAVEVSEVVHDPELDEAVIAFANADFDQCEQALQQLIGAGGARAQHAETWLVLFDLYRATGQQQTLREPGARLRAAVRLVGAAVVLAAQAGGRRARPKNGRTAAAPRRPARSAGSAPQRWTSRPWRACARRRCRCRCPGSSTGARCDSIDAEAAMQLSALLRLWAGQALDMRWIGGERLFDRAAGSRAHRRARRRPGLLADAPGRAAPGQPAPTSSTKPPSTTASPTRCRRRRGSARAARCASAARA